MEAKNPPQAEPLNTTYLCEKVTEDPARFNEKTAMLKRTDGVAGWFKIGGSDARNLEAGKEYVITCQERGATIQ